MSRRNTTAWLGSVAVLSAAFVIFKTCGFHPYSGDEHIYVYQGSLVAQGVRPYAEVGSAHPPVQLLLVAALTGPFGYHFGLFRWLPVLACLGAGVCVAVVARREFGGVASVGTMATFLFSYEPLRAATHFTGVNLTCLLLAGSLLALRSRRAAAGGVLGAAALLTRFYALPGLAAIFAWTLWRDRAAALRYALAGAIAALVSLLAMAIWSGPGNLYRELVAYHAGKTPMDPAQRAGVLRGVVFHDSMTLLLILLAVVALLVGRWKRGRRDATTDLALLGLLGSVAYLVLLFTMGRVFNYYFVPAILFAALPAGWLVGRWAEAARFSFRNRTFGQRLEWSLLGVFVLGWIASPLLERIQPYYADRVASPERSVVSYTWRPPPLPGWLAGAIRATFWSDERRIGRRYPNLTYLLWHESRVLDITPEIVGTLRERADPGDEIFGDSTSVPLMALLAGVPITGHLVDTNVQRFRSGLLDAAEVVAHLERAGTRFMLLRPRFGVAGREELIRLVRDRYRLLREFRTERGRTYLLYERREPGENQG